VLALLGCGRNRSSGLIETSPEAMAAVVLRLQLETEDLRAWSEALGRRSIQSGSLDSLQDDLALAASLLLANEGRAGHQEVRAAAFAILAAEVHHGCYLVDLAGSARGIRRAVRSNVNKCVEYANVVSTEMKKDWRWPLTHAREASAALERAELFGENAREVGELAEVLHAGAVAANVQIAAVSLARLAASAPAALSRLVAWIAGRGAPGASLQLVGVGSDLRILAVVGTEVLTLTEAEVIALVQVGELAVSSVALLYLARGHLHHICTDKNLISDASGGPWTPRFEPFFEGAGIGFDDPANLVEVEGHIGPHPMQYHQLVFRRLNSAVDGLTPGTTAYREAVLKELRALAKLIQKPGSPLNKLVTGAAP
jgi:hypothetical protein